MKTLAIFGSTGSIGKTSLKILENNKKKFKLLFLSAHSNYKKLKVLEKKFNPNKIFLTNKNLNTSYSLYDKNIILEKDLFCRNNKIDYVISGVSGYDAIEFNFKLLKITNNLLIANKETIICGGNFFLDQAKKFGCNILPIDSEHYCINYFFQHFGKISKNNIEKVYLIASGGPLLNKKKNYNEKLKNVLNHPNWKMGKKITIDSSNLSNKILELFEAKILFDIPKNKLEVLIEPSSNTHAIIKLKNNLCFPIMHKPDMEIPISNSLNVRCDKKLKFKNLNISFLSADSKKFPIIKLGYEILRHHKNTAMIFFTVLNDRLAKLYLKSEIKYGDIHFYLVKAFKKKLLQKYLKKKINNVNDILEIIKLAEKIELK